MSWLVRANPETPCQPNEAHHPHRWVCGDPDCDNVHDYGFCDITALTCCLDGQDWPCATKREHEAQRRSKHEEHRP